jgi:hypothetical protein
MDRALAESTALAVRTVEEVKAGLRDLGLA